MGVLSLAEGGQSTQAISLASLVEKKRLVAAVNEAMTIPRMAEVIALEGFSSIEERGEALDSRLRALRKNTTRLGSTLRAYSQLLGTHASMAALRRAMGSAALDRTTLSSYHRVLEAGGIIRDLPPYTPMLTSPTPVLQAPCRQLTDPVIACSVLAFSANDLLDDLATMDRLFTTLCVRDLRRYSQPLGATLGSYRDKSGLTCDCVITDRRGRVALVAPALGGSLIERAAARLVKLAGKLDESSLPDPAVLIVLTAERYAYTRSDGVHVVPLACLGW